jgi:hypothetical protein
MLLTLESAQQSFAWWRSARVSRREPILTKLWQQVQSLLTCYPSSQVCRALRLSGSPIKQHCKKRTQGSDEVFLSVTPSLMPFSAPEPCEIKLQCGDKLLMLSLNADQLPQVLPAFKALL